MRERIPTVVPIRSKIPYDMFTNSLRSTTGMGIRLVTQGNNEHHNKKKNSHKAAARMVAWAGSIFLPYALNPKP